MKRFLLPSLLLLGAICLPVASFAANVYTDANGLATTGNCRSVVNGSGACTLDYAITQWSCGDTLWLADGTYSPTTGVTNAIRYGILLRKTCGSGTVATIKATNRNQAIIRPSGYSSGIINVLVFQASYIVVDGLKADCGTHVANSGIGCSGMQAIDSDHITFQNGAVTNAGGGVDGNTESSAMETSNSHDVNFLNNDITNVGVGDIDGDFEHGIYIAGEGGTPGGSTYNIVADGNRISGVFPGYGVQVYHTGACNSGCVVRNNVFFNGHKASGIIANGTGGLWYNNISYGHDLDGLKTYGSPTNWGIYNNVFYGNTRYGFYIDTSSGSPTGTIIKNNIFLSNGSGGIQSSGVSITCSNNLNIVSCSSTAQGNTNLFVNATGSDFHLAVNDNGGIDLTSVGITFDKDGQPRGNPPDRGAYEFASSSNSVTRYADDNGTDTTHATCTAVQTGSSACTFAHAAAVMASGDTLQLADGTYNETCIECVPNGASSSLMTTIKAANPLQAIFAPTGPSVSQVFRLSGVSNLIIDGIVASCGSGPTSCVPFQSYPNGATNVILRNGEAKNGAGTVGDGIAGGWVSSQIRNMLVHDNGTCPSGEQTSHGINLWNVATNTVVDGNDIYNQNCAYGIEIYNGFGNVANNTISNNKIHSSKFAMDLGSAGGTTANTAYNNLIYSNQRGIEVGGTGSFVYHNVIYSNTEFCVSIKASGNSVQIKNNICLSNGNGALQDLGAVTICSNNMNVTGCQVTQGSTNPFLNAGSANFHLAANDNAGVYIPLAALDKDGVARTDPPDRGAYEFAGSGTTAGPSIFGTRIVR